MQEDTANIYIYIYRHTHRWRQIHVSRLVFLFPCPPNPSINHLNFYCIKQIDYIFPCWCTVLCAQRVKNNSHVTRLRLVLFLFTRCDVFCHYYSRHTRKNVIYLLNIGQEYYKVAGVLPKYSWGLTFRAKTLRQRETFSFSLRFSDEGLLLETL